MTLRKARGGVMVYEVCKRSGPLFVPTTRLGA